MESHQFNYQELIDLGFSRYDLHDAVDFKRTGHHPFVLELKLAKRLWLNCHSEDMICKVLMLNKEKSIIGQSEITGMSNLKQWLKIFGKEVKSEN